MKLELALNLLLLTIPQVYHLPRSLPSPSVTLLACSLDASPYMPDVVLYCKVKTVSFIFVFVSYVLFV